LNICTRTVQSQLERRMFKGPTAPCFLGGEHLNSPCGPKVYPHEAFAAIWSCGGQAFVDTQLGPTGEAAAAEFWAHEHGKPWLQGHPVLDQPEQLSTCIPWSLYGDAVQPGSGPYSKAAASFAVFRGGILHACAKLANHVDTPCPEVLVVQCASVRHPLS